MKKHNPAGQNQKTQLYLSVAVVLAALIFYSVLMLLRVPAAIGLFVRYNLVLLSLIALPVLFCAFKIRGTWGTFAALTVTLVLFSLPVLGIWESGGSEPFIIGGLIPFSDASSYYSDAQRVVEGYKFSAFSARRPLFPALLTVLLALTGQNLMVTIAILTAFIAVACYIATREIQRSLGTLSSVLFLFILFLFFRRISATTMTENLGLPLGVCAFVVLWSAAKQKNQWLVYLGLLLLTLALNARAGTFFILPALMLWAGFAFREKRKFSFLAFVLSGCSVILGFLLNMLVFKLVADPGGMVFSNFSYTLYGVVAGGKGWMQILIDHPELAALDDVSRSALTYELVFEAWKAHPLNVVIGACKNWLDYLLPRGAGAFGFIRGNQADWINYAVRVLFSLFALTGLVASWRGRKTEPNTMLLFAIAGIFLSIPFVPPNDSNQMRVYAATITFLICFTVIGFKNLLQLINNKSTESPKFSSTNPKPAICFGSALAVLAVVGVLVVKAVAKPAALQTASCPEGSTELFTRINRGTVVNISKKQINELEGQSNVSLASFETTFEGFAEMHEQLSLAGENSDSGIVLTRPLDLFTLQYPLLILPTEYMPSKPGLITICARPAENDELNMRGYWTVDSVIHISNWE